MFLINPNLHNFATNGFEVRYLALNSATDVSSGHQIAFAHEIVYIKSKKILILFSVSHYKIKLSANILITCNIFISFYCLFSFVSKL